MTEAKKYFSKIGCPAYQIADKYLNGSAIRQNYLETAIKWIAARDGIELEEYMSAHQHDTNCNGIWLYFQSVVNWVKATFPKYRKEMKGIEWGILYNVYKDVSLDPDVLEARIKALMMDDDVTNKRGVYTYLLSGEEKHLSIRAFTESQKRAAYERQEGVCSVCKQRFTFEEMQGDHITPWSKGGKTVPENCKMLCAECNRRKGGI